MVDSWCVPISSSRPTSGVSWRHLTRLPPLLVGRKQNRTVNFGHSLDCVGAPLLGDEQPSNLVLHAVRYQRRSRLCKCLHPSRNVRRVVKYLAGGVNNHRINFKADARDKLRFTAGNNLQVQGNLAPSLSSNPRLGSASTQRRLSPSPGISASPCAVDQALGLPSPALNSFGLSAGTARARPLSAAPPPASATR